MPGVANVREVVVGGGQALGALASWPVSRGRFNDWGSTGRERAAAMPGDELVPQSRRGYTRAVTIEVPPQQVWPWLAQMGRGRGGLYSFDGLENLFGCGIHSTEAILPEAQAIAVGDLIAMGPDGYPCFRVHSLDPGNWLVLVGADPKPPHEAAAAQSPAGVSTWQWQLTGIAPARTRLVVRQRQVFPDNQRVMWGLVAPVGFVMERQMLLGIKRRAEAATPGDDRAS